MGRAVVNVTVECVATLLASLPGGVEIVGSEHSDSGVLALVAEGSGVPDGAAVITFDFSISQGERLVRVRVAS